jgi:hypothetical protein
MVLQSRDNTSLPATHYEANDLTASVAQLEKIFILTAVPTIVLDSSLCICQVSDSHLCLSNLSRANIVGSSIFDIPLSTIPVASLPGSSGSHTDRHIYESCPSSDWTGKPIPHDDTRLCRIPFHTPCHRSP